MHSLKQFDQTEEIKRLQELLSYGILDTPYEKEFDDLAKLISIICEAPVAFISMMDDKIQWHKTKVGSDTVETPKEETFCQYTIQQDDVLEISDATKDRGC